jgi:hypothetical protein
MSTRPSTPNTVIYDNEYKASNMAATFRPASGKSLLAPPPASYHSPVSPDRSDDAHRYVYQYAQALTQQFVLQSRNLSHLHLSEFVRSTTFV